MTGDCEAATPSFVRALQRARSQLRGDCIALREALVAFDRDPAPMAELAAEVDREEMAIAVVGEVNRGKSTFMNALVGTRLFPPAATVCTAALTRLRDGQPRGVIEWRDGKSERFVVDAGSPVEGLRGLVSKKNPDASKIAAVNLWYPNRFARDGVVLIDTPGVNDPERWREEITVTALQSADAAIFLLDAHAVVSGTETMFLRQNIFGSLVSRVLFVVNKADQLSEAERRKVLSRTTEMLARLSPEPRIFMLSAREALEARLQGDETRLRASGLLKFEDHLDRVLTEERVHLHFGSRAQRIQRERTVLAGDIQFAISASEQAAGDIKEGVRRAKTQLATLRLETKVELAARNKAFAELPNEVATHATRAFEVATQARLRSPPAVADLDAIAQRATHADLRATVLARVDECRRDALGAAEAYLKQRRDEIRLDAGSALGQLERKIGEARALIVAAPATRDLSALDLPMDITETPPQQTPGSLFAVGGIAAAAALMAGSGGLAIFLLAAGVAAEVAVAGAQVVRTRLNPGKIDESCGRVGRAVIEDSRAAGKRFSDRASQVLGAEVRRRIDDAERLLEQTERRASLDGRKVQEERERLARLLGLVCAVRGEVSE